MILHKQWMNLLSIYWLGHRALRTEYYYRFYSCITMLAEYKMMHLIELIWIQRTMTHQSAKLSNENYIQIFEQLALWYVVFYKHYWYNTSSSMNTTNVYYFVWNLLKSKKFLSTKTVSMSMMYNLLSFASLEFIKTPFCSPTLW